VKPCGLAILKKSGHGTQKWGVIGSDGCLRACRIDNRQLSERYAITPSSGKSEAVLSNKDEFFFSCSREICQASRKGIRTKFRDSPLENDISHLFMLNGQLVACSGSLCARVKPNPTTATLPAVIVGGASLGQVLYLGCGDGTLHSFVDTDAHLVHRFPAVITCVASFPRTQIQSFVVIGTADSRITFLNTNEAVVSSLNLNSPATAIAAFDFDKDNFAELLIALEDSTVSLVNLALIETPKVVSSLQLGFNVSNIGIGFVYSADMVSAIVTSQTGQLGIVFVEPKSDRSVLSGKTPKVTEREIEELAGRVRELEQRAAAQATKPPVTAVEATIEVKGDPVLEKFSFLAESDRPIARVALGSSIPITYTARPDCQANISLSPPRRDKVQFGVVIRPLDATATRLAFDFAYEIGRGGNLVCFLSFAKSQFVFSKTFTLKPFGLLKKVGDDLLSKFTDDQLGILRVNGAHSSSAFRDIIDQSLPSALDDEEPQTFASGSIGSLVTVLIHGDSFVAKSVFFPIVVQLRTFILESMNAKKQKVAFETKLGDSCLSTFFGQVKDRLIVVMSAAAFYFKLLALQEVRNSSPTADFGDPETARILQDAADIERAFEGCKHEYHAYLKEVEIFYIEMWRRSNIDASGRVDAIISALKEVRDDTSVQTLIELMKSSPR
jgi:hypothetical protein